MRYPVQTLGAVWATWLAMGVPGAMPSGAAEAANSDLPVRGLHLSAPGKGDLAKTLAFIREVLPPTGVNTLVLEFNYGFDFQTRPEFSAERKLNLADVRSLVAACRDGGIELIPLLNCLGHQSWSKRNGELLTTYPEFDESPGKYPANEGIYCRSYCPLHPGLHPILFDLITELAAACEAKSFHVGMDEVFILADPDCPRCGGQDPAELFAGEVTRLRDHLDSIGCRMWMWGDRFLDGAVTGLGEWEASKNHTWGALDRIPKDIVICDWHYNAAPNTPQFFAGKGFDVVTSPWRKPAVARAQLDHLRTLRAGPNPPAGHALGVLQTTWCGASPFIQAHRELADGGAPSRDAASEAADCFRKLFQAIRTEPNDALRPVPPRP